MAPRNIKYLALQPPIAHDVDIDFDPYATNDGDIPDTPSTAVNPIIDQSKSPEKLLVQPLCPSQSSKRGYFDASEGPKKQSLPPLSGSPEETRRSRKGYLFSSFEVPKWRPITLHILLCIIAYPILKICVFIAQNRSLFWTRFIVGVGCGIVGLTLSLTLLGLGRPFLEAATWATVIHLSRAENNAGIKLEDLATASTDAASLGAGVRLLWARVGHSSTSRSARKTYDRRFWTLYILFFLLLMTLAATISFALGRLIDITATLTHQNRDYEEVAVSGLNSASDLTQAGNFIEDVKGFLTFFFTWAPSTFSHRDKLPLVASFNFGTDKVYFAETTLSQLLPGGHGFGTFDDTFFNPSIVVDEDSPTVSTTAPVTRNALDPIDPGYMLRFPKWGTRMHCAKPPNAESYMRLPHEGSNNGTDTIVFTPRETVRDLFDSFNVTLHDPGYHQLITHVKDTLPARDASDAMSSNIGPDNGDAITIFTHIWNPTNSSSFWAIIEHVLIRLNTTYAPNGKFARLSNSSVPIGYDSAVCVGLFEPWVVETYNGTTGAPSARSLISYGTTVQDLGEPGIKERRFGPPITDPAVNRTMNPTDLNLVDLFIHLAINSVTIVERDARNSEFYSPSQTLMSLTDGVRMRGYTELDPNRYAEYRASEMALHVLPYMAGSGQLVARRYPDLVIANAFIHPRSMLSFLAGVLVMGLVAGLFVPKLPLNTRQRGFQLYSWLAMFRAQELVCEEMETIGRNMELKDIENRFGGLRFRYVDPMAAGQDQGYPKEVGAV